MAQVFPPSNLPGRAVTWGRAVEARIVQDEKNLEQSKSASNNGLRATSGGLSVMASDISELYERSLEFVNQGDISVTGSVSVETFPRVSRTVSFQAPTRDRRALVSLYGVVSNSTTNVSNVGDRMGVVLRYNGEIIATAISQANLPASTPNEWRNSMDVNLRAAVNLPAGVVPEFTITVLRAGGYYFQQVPPYSELPSPASTMTLSNVQVSLEKSGV